MSSALRIFSQPTDRDAWDALVDAAPGGHVLQSWAWGELKAGFGWRVQRLSVGLACAQVLYRHLPVRRLPAGLGSLAYVPKGPLVDFGDEPACRALLDAIRSQARSQHAFCLKIEPAGEDDPMLAGQLRALGFRPSPQPIQPRRTLLVDLAAEPEELLARMKQKTRYNVRLAARRGVTVRRGDEADLAAFYRLMEATARRDGFGIHSRAYYEATYRLFVPQGRGRLLLAKTDGRLLAGLMVLGFGRSACYLVGASSDEQRNLMPTYLLQWEAMLWARDQGYPVYDLWGVPDEEEVTLEAGFEGRSDGLWGVYRFKRGFGGALARTSGAWDLVYSPLRYRLYTAAVGWLNRGQVA
jgi:peptidoglycan pentaglycine glycine transferase (the first glycine)